MGGIPGYCFLGGFGENGALRGRSRTLRLLYLSPKHVSDQVPQPYRQWLQLIQDSLDEQADESCYDKPELQTILDLIKVDGLTPQDRARLKDEYALEQAVQQEKQEEFEKGIEVGEQRGKLEIARQLQAQGMSIELIEQLTGLSRDLWQ